MFYSELVRKACLISFEAHKNDTDKGGYPYFCHPFFLAAQFDDEAAVCVALLHDVIEDHGDRYSFDFLQKEGFGDEIIGALTRLTHREGMDYMSYIRALAADPIARRVKTADLKHNMDTRRTDGVPPPKVEQYRAAYEYLSSYEG